MAYIIHATDVSKVEDGKVTGWVTYSPMAAYVSFYYTGGQEPSLVTPAPIAAKHQELSLTKEDNETAVGDVVQYTLKTTVPYILEDVTDVNVQFRITDMIKGAKYVSNKITVGNAAAGSSTVTLENIPAGLTVTVDEIYSGASYTADGSKEETALIVSDAAVAAGEEAASVAFRNRYSGGNRGGYGVTNHFESDGAGGWTWENPTVMAGQ